MADVFGKNRYHVKDTWPRIHRACLAKGKWNQTKYQSLFNLVNKDLQMHVYEEKKLKHGMISDAISWKAIDSRLATRTNIICCMKWYKQLSSSMVQEDFLGWLLAVLKTLTGIIFLSIGLETSL